MPIFSLSRKIPDEKERSESTDRLFAMQSFANSIFFIRILLGPVALLQLRSDMSMISLYVHGLIKIDSLHGFFKKLLRCIS